MPGLYIYIYMYVRRGLRLRRALHCDLCNQFVSPFSNITNLLCVDLFVYMCLSPESNTVTFLVLLLLLLLVEVVVAVGGSSGSSNNSSSSSHSSSISSSRW
jgi:hypothetical protein